MNRTLQNNKKMKNAYFSVKYQFSLMTRKWWYRWLPKKWVLCTIIKIYLKDGLTYSIRIICVSKLYQGINDRFNAICYTFHQLTKYVFQQIKCYATIFLLPYYLQLTYYEVIFQQNLKCQNTTHDCLFSVQHFPGIRVQH